MGGDASHTKPIVVSKADSVRGIDVGPSLDALQGSGGYQSVDFPRPNSPQFKDARGENQNLWIIRLTVREDCSSTGERFVSPGGVWVV